MAKRLKFSIKGFKIVRKGNVARIDTNKFRYKEEDYNNFYIILKDHENWKGRKCKKGEIFIVLPSLEERFILELPKSIQCDDGLDVEDVVNILKIEWKEVTIEKLIKEMI